MGDRPFVFMNMAMTADGKIAEAGRSFESMGSRRDQIHLLELRAEADAIMVGARTLMGAPIDLGNGGERFRRLRIRNGLKEQSIRVIVSGSGSITPEAYVFKHRFSPILVITTQKSFRKVKNTLSGYADCVEAFGRESVDFSQALTWLREKWLVKRLLVEGGGKLNDSLFREQLVDEMHLTVCPLVLGGSHAPTIADGVGAVNLGKATPLSIKSMKRAGNELFLVMNVQPTR